MLGTEKDDNTTAMLPADVEPGDVIAYANAKVDHPYQHCTPHLGGGKVACHSASRQSGDWTSIGLSYVTFLHIDS